ncbi:vanadium-dependent haloperoxidase [Gelidibacter maritimus]|uniref:Vanadium-dependent haloperoxidase n=1 Tax=Gelidibacter maritimus TaxID=2761487 RepID=A0A7W2M7B3_9FLAO|nr:vanadium-dependent haloperoxidase [Gelidibacter maritimus]MBA6154072.1 vanadium-dependent haloperoxidase [Gelidibacter maritimus]
MYFIKQFIIWCFITLCLGCASEKKNIEIYPDDYHKLVDMVTGIMVHDVYSPPVASRIYIYPNIASYEVLNQNSETYNSLVGQVNGLATLDVPAVDDDLNLKLASIIAYIDVAKELVFSKDILVSYRDSLYGNWNTHNSKEFSSAKAYGLNISKQILQWMEEDNYRETRSMPNFNVYEKDPSRWKPTPPAYMNGIEPHWDKIRTFVLDSASQFMPLPPPEFSMKPKTDFHNEVMAVYNVVNEIRALGDTSEEIEIARFWDCNPFVTVNKGHFMFAEKKITPGAHWMGICQIVSKDSNSDFEKTVFAYTKTSMGIADAFISCWDEKYRSNLIRPETLINEYIDADWTPLLQTPPFPEYSSGHSVVSGSAAEVLTAIFGDNISFDDTTELPYGLPVRAFSSFRAAAEEAAISRLYGGIHYPSAINEGLSQGVRVGTLVNSEIKFIKNQ